MKRILFLFLFCLLGGALSAQTLESLKLSSVPSAQELTNAFVSVGRGRIDPFVVLPAIIAKGDTPVPALSTLLFSDSIIQVIRYQHLVKASGTDTGYVALPEYDTLHPNKLYAAMALEGIGTQASYGVLFQAATQHTDPNVRGFALSALANTFHTSNYLPRVAPDVELVHLLLKNVDDTTRVPFFQKSFGQIAREGLMNWTGLDMGDPQGLHTKVKVGASLVLTALSDLREQWWQANMKKVAWNTKTGCFSLP
jgi:hypothetical protein